MTLSFQEALFTHLEQLPRPALDRLYSDSATCFGVLRCLPELAKTILLRLCLIDSSASVQSIIDSVKDEAISDLKISLRLMQSLSICHLQQERLLVHEEFRLNLIQALTCSGNSSSFGLPSDSSDKHSVDIEFLDKYSVESWEAVLHYLVGTASDSRPVAVTKLLEKSGLMSPSTTDGSLVITNKGFQFLLQDTSVQVWEFLLQYLEMSHELNMNQVEVLNFLFQLGSLQLGQDYSISPLTTTQQHMLDDLRHLGLIYQRKKKSSRFYPTRIATLLTSGHVLLDSKQQQGFIILLTIASPLQIAVLSLFADLKSRFPNMVMGLLSRDSVREALEKGITSEQIISYLQVHAHPEMKSSGNMLPTTVVDQLRIWDKERNRIKATIGSLYQQFSRHQDYSDVLKYAQDMSCLVWKCEKRRLICVTASGHEIIREYVKRRIANRTSDT